VVTGEPYGYAASNPITYSDPLGLCTMISGDLWCSGSNYGRQGDGYIPESEILPAENVAQAYRIWRDYDGCSQCTGFEITGGFGPEGETYSCFGVSGCTAAADYLLYETGGNPQAATDEQFAQARWIAANYCQYDECGNGNALTYSNWADLMSAASGALLVAGGFVDDAARVASSSTASVFNPGRFLDDVFETVVRSPAGDVGVMAEMSVTGRTLHITDMIIFNLDGGPLVNQVGARAFLAMRNQIATEAAAAGFTTLRITGVRVMNSSSANPGYAMDRVIDLARFLP
jgi:hypothetical protein